MSSKNPYKPDSLSLEPGKKKIWVLMLLGALIYAVITLIIISLSAIPASIRIFTIFTYIIVGPLSFYAIWLLFYHWKRKKWPINEEMFGSPLKYMMLFLIMGVCVINWSAYWNTGIDVMWEAIAILYYLITNDVFGAQIIYSVGATAITPALVEEFNKSFPSILAFFVVLQRSNKSDQKNKGMLGNELNGFLIGLLIGLTFEGIETASYIVLTLLSGGDVLLLYLQVTLRNWGPIHILGGCLGGYAAGRAERLRFEFSEETFPMKTQIRKFLRRFIPIWLIPVILHFAWNSTNVWILLIFLAFGIQDSFVYLLAVIITQLGLAVLCFIILYVFYKRANKVAKDAYRCPNTGLIVASQEVSCEEINDIRTAGTKSVADHASEININYCPNCRNVVKPTDNFCRNCRFDLRQIRSSRKPFKLYESATTKLFIINIIAAIIFLIVNIGLFILILLSNPIVGLAFFFIQGISELITVTMMIYSALNLRKLRQDYDGRKSIWNWLFFLFNLVGITVTLIVFGIIFVIPLILSILTGIIPLIQLLIVVVFLPGTIIILYLLKKVLNNEKQVLQYQRWY